MDSTSVSLLRRLRDPSHDEAWKRFVELYAPLIFHWSRSQGLSKTDSADLVQDVLMVLVTELATFEYDPKKRFRGWLRTVTVNQSRDYMRRKAARPASGHDETIRLGTATNPVDLFEEAEYRSYLAGRALELMRSEFKDPIWQACWMQVVEERKPVDVAHALSMSLNAVYLAKSRVLGRLREELRLIRLKRTLSGESSREAARSLRDLGFRRIAVEAF